MRVCVCVFIGFSIYILLVRGPAQYAGQIRRNRKQIHILYSVFNFKAIFHGMIWGRWEAKFLMRPTVSVSSNGIELCMHTTSVWSYLNFDFIPIGRRNRL